MATCTFGVRIGVDLAVIIASPTLIDASRQRVTTATEDTTRTARVCVLAAKKVESVLGAVGSYDDADATIGDQDALEIGIRIALHLYLHAYSMVQTAETNALWQDLLKELRELAEKRVAEVTPVYGQPDNTELDALYPTKPLWEAEE